MKRGLLATRSELAGLQGRLGRKPFDHIYEALQKRCAMILESRPITETMWRSAYSQGVWGAATSAVASLQGRIFDLTISHNIDRNYAYRDRAIEELKNLLNFPTWVDPSHGGLDADLCTGEACATAAIALDWLADELTDADRILCIRAIRRKGLLAYLKAVESGAFWYNCYHNWNAVTNCGAGIAGLLLQDEEDAAAETVSKARAGLNNFFKALGREGGWDEGLGYWGYAMRYLLLFGEAQHRSTGNGDIFQQRGMETTGLFPIYFSPHGTAVSFGDRPVAATWGAFYLLAKHYGLKEVAWWLDRYAFRHDVSTAGYSDAGLALLFRPPDQSFQPDPDLMPVKVFNEIGWAAIADHWPSPHLYAALKTGDLSAHHAQLDMNSVQVAVDGEVILQDPGSPDFSHEYLSIDGRYGFYEVQARSHNTVTVGGRGQRIDAVGGIVEAKYAKEYRWVVGDAGAALGEDVRFVRHLVMPVDAGDEDRAMLIVLDEISNPASEKIIATWHTHGSVTLAEDGRSGLITGDSTVVHFALAGTCKLNVEIDEKILSHRRTDHIIKVSTTARSDAVLAAVFSTRPVEKAVLRRDKRGNVTLGAGDRQLSWSASTRHLQFEGIGEER